MGAISESEAASLVSAPELTLVFIEFVFTQAYVFWEVFGVLLCVFSFCSFGCGYARPRT